MHLRLYSPTVWLLPDPSRCHPLPPPPPPPAPPPVDGSFPNHTPNPEDKKAVQATRVAVLEAGADLGIMLDTDVDRSGVVDAAGNGAWARWCMLACRAAFA